MTAADRIRAFNRGRDPERLAMKLRAIRNDPFQFLRGTCHLFYERLPRDPLLRRAPDAWLCGDLHLQNMGSYKGDNRLVYYDINDFDEAALGPCTIDLLRFATSILIAADDLSIGRGEALSICGGAIDAYAAALRTGQARWVEAETAQGLIAELLHKLARPGRRRLLNARTIPTGRGRRLRADGRKALPATSDDRERVTLFMKELATRHDNPRFFKMIDVARRVAGTGSLGVSRFVILVEGKGSPDGNFLLDLKELPAFVPDAAPHDPPAALVERGRASPASRSGCRLSRRRSCTPSAWTACGTCCAICSRRKTAWTCPSFVAIQRACALPSRGWGGCLPGISSGARAARARPSPTI
jgi:uncharacterized protein (DUF2252 family)